jgi:low affinity Fe/Cu permease
MSAGTAQVAVYARSMERTDAAQSREKSQGLSGFEQMVEATHGKVSRPPFFVLVVVIVIMWAVSAPLWPDPKSWQVVIHTISSVLALLLLVLLENSGRRAEEAAQEKLNVVAAALAELMDAQVRRDPGADEDLEEAARQLRDAVGLEERH